MTGVWSAAGMALLPPLLLALVAAGRGGIGARLLALQLATSLSILLLICLSFAFDQPSTIDLAVTLALLSMPGTVLLAHFLERWV